MNLCAGWIEEQRPATVNSINPTESGARLLRSDSSFALFVKFTEWTFHANFSPFFLLFCSREGADFSLPWRGGEKQFPLETPIERIVTIAGRDLLLFLSRFEIDALESRDGNLSGACYCRGDEEIEFSLEGETYWIDPWNCLLIKSMWRRSPLYLNARTTFQGRVDIDSLESAEFFESSWYRLPNCNIFSGFKWNEIVDSPLHDHFWIQWKGVTNYCVVWFGVTRYGPQSAARRRVVNSRPR